MYVKECGCNINLYLTFNIIITSIQQLFCYEQHFGFGYALSVLTSNDNHILKYSSFN